jgi:hypothetical protein
MSKPREISNVDVVVYVLGLLGGAEKTVYSEEVAAKCYQVAPARFSWRLPAYREKGWPDKYIVKTALEDAKKEDYGALVDGAYALDIVRDGWRLTPKGAAWLRQRAEHIEKNIAVREKGLSVPKREEQRFLKQMRSQPLYESYKKPGGLALANRFAFTDMLNCSPDTSEDTLLSKFKRLRARAEIVGDEDIIRFLDACRDAFLTVNR